MIRKHTISIKNAFNGLIWSLKTQPNFRIHIFFSAIAIIAGFLLKISYTEFLVVLLLITAGFTIETINTSIEETTDAIDTKWRKDIGLAKDVSAGAMLAFSLGAISIATVIFLPKIIALFFR